MTESQGMRQVWILTVSMCLLSICYTMLVPFLPVYLMDLGVPTAKVPLWSGVCFSVTFLVAGLMAPVWGKMADEHGKKMMAIRAAFFIGLSYLACGFVTGPWEFLAARAFQGFANGFMPAAMTMVSLSVPQEKAGTALGIFQTGLILGNVIGPVVGGVVEAAIGMRPVFFMSTVVLFAVTIAVWILVKEPTLPPEELAKAQADSTLWEDIKMASKDSHIMELLSLFFILQAAILMLQPIVALYVGELLGSMQHAVVVSGTILSIGGFAGVITTNLWTAFGQRRGYFRGITLAIGGTGLFLLLQSLPFGIWWFGCLQILVGCCIVGVSPSLSAALTVTTEPSMRGRLFGLATTAQQFGNTVGPLFASLITMALSIHAVFISVGIMLCIVCYALYKKHSKHAPICS